MTGGRIRTTIPSMSTLIIIIIIIIIQGQVTTSLMFMVKVTLMPMNFPVKMILMHLEIKTCRIWDRKGRGMEQEDGEVGNGVRLVR